ncbi:hypothetical protein [Leucobacter sp. USHLN153]|uniref:hypothetical protein n=1 Tax=Leucobacter sp. USHLN153 TaxID=3081268 RepID=UPI00301981C5
MSDQDPYENPLTRKTTSGGRAGVVIASLVPFVALALFFLFGFAGCWSWSWIFFLLIPVSGIIVYGVGRNQQR